MAIACSCHGIRDQVIRDAAAGGCSSVEEVASVTGAGSRCGGCHPTIEMLIAAEQALDAALGPIGAPLTAA